MVPIHANLAKHGPKVEVDESHNGKRKRRRTTPQEPECPDRIVGRALEARRRQAEERITRGGWKPKIVEMAIEYLQDRAWYDRSSKIWGVRCFVRDAEDLGEFCKDWKAIRHFLDKNIHKFIAFHAMEQDFKVPHYLIHKADQRKRSCVWKYAWLRSFLQEYQGEGKSTAESLVQVYRSQDGPTHAKDRTSQDTEVDQDGNSGRAMTTAPPTMGMRSVHGHGKTASSTETCRVTLDSKDEHSRKRQRGSDSTVDLDTNDFIKKAKRESTEGIFVTSPDTTEEIDTGEIDTSEKNDGKGMIHTKGRTLTVLFYGMGHNGDDESEHVQVYVPRTSKGVTINFL